MLLGELPEEKDVQELTANWQRRSHVPNYVFDAIEALPVNTHPMTQFVIAIMALQTESVFAKKYAEGMNKKDYWECYIRRFHESDCPASAGSCLYLSEKI